MDSADSYPPMYFGSLTLPRTRIKFAKKNRLETNDSVVPNTKKAAGRHLARIGFLFYEKLAYFLAH